MSVAHKAVYEGKTGEIVEKECFAVFDYTKKEPLHGICTVKWYSYEEIADASMHE